MAAIRPVLSSHNALNCSSPLLQCNVERSFLSNVYFYRGIVLFILYVCTWKEFKSSARAPTTPSTQWHKTIYSRVGTINQLIRTLFEENWFTHTTAVAFFNFQIKIDWVVFHLVRQKCCVPKTIHFYFSLSLCLYSSQQNTRHNINLYKTEKKNTWYVCRALGTSKT